MSRCRKRPGRCQGGPLTRQLQARDEGARGNTGGVKSTRLNSQQESNPGLFGASQADGTEGCPAPTRVRFAGAAFPSQPALRLVSASNFALRVWEDARSRQTERRGSLTGKKALPTPPQKHHNTNSRHGLPVPSPQPVGKRSE